MNKDEEIKMLKEKIVRMEERQLTNKEQQLEKLAKLFGEKAFYTEYYGLKGEKKSYQKLKTFYDACGRLGKDNIIDLIEKINKFAKVEE